MNYKTAKTYADQVMDILRPFCERIQVAGSVRRRSPEVNDIEVVYMLKTSDAGMGSPDYSTKLWLTLCNTWKVVKGHRGGKYIRVRIKDVGIEVDLFRATRGNWGLIYAIRTGPADYSHNVLARGWSEGGYHAEGGVLYPVIANKDATCKEDILDRENPVYVTEEAELYKLINLPWIPPEARR